MYDPVIGRWGGVDPMATERTWLSPYNYVQNNPMLRIDPDGRLDDCYNREGQFLYRDTRTTDNIRIIDQGDFDAIASTCGGGVMNDQSTSNLGLLGDLESKSNSISGSGISVEAASNVFTDILDKAKFDISKLHNGKISIDGGPNNPENANDGSDLSGYGKIASGQYKGQINPLTGNPYTYTGNAPNGTIKVTGMYNSKSGTPHLTTVSNVISILGIHEFRGHAQMGLSHSPSDHRIIYRMQEAHKATFDKLTPAYRQHILDMSKK
jgi:hypothetical protein